MRSLSFRTLSLDPKPHSSSGNFRVSNQSNRSRYPNFLRLEVVGDSIMKPLTLAYLIAIFLAILGGTLGEHLHLTLRFVTGTVLILLGLCLVAFESYFEELELEKSV